MATKVQICNKSLIHVGQSNTLQALTESSPEGRLFNQVYDENRQELLRRWAWGFATKEQTLSESGSTPSNSWTYEYQYPNDCLRFLHIVNANGRTLPPPPHQKGRNAAKETIIWSDEWQAVGLFVEDVEDPNKFDAGFRAVLSLLCAVDVCLPLTQNAALQDKLVQRAVAAFMTAATADSGETTFEDMPDPDWILERAG